MPLASSPYIKKIILIAGCLLTLFIYSRAQCVEYIIGFNGDTLNCKDKKGQKQGKWTNKVEELRGEPGYEEEGVYQNNEKTGYWRVFTLQGDLIGIETYRYGQKNGLQQYFNSVGNLVKEESWLAHNPENPTEIVEVYDINDPSKVYQVEVKMEASAVPHGIWKLYDPESGKIIRKDNYILGKLDDGSGTGNGLFKNKEGEKDEKGETSPTEQKEKPKEKPKPREVQDFEKKNEGKKKFKIRTGETG